MTDSIEQLDSVCGDLSARLRKAGVTTTRALLRRAAAPADRAALARDIGAADGELDRGVQCADLLRIDGVGPAYIALLVAAGFRDPQSVADEALATAQARLTAARARAPGVRRLPAAKIVARWIEDAATLQAIVIWIDGA